MIVDVAGTAAFVHSGTGPIDPDRKSVVFVHGVGLDHTVWTLPARYFARHGYNVAAVDLPGHGRSQGQPPATISDSADWVAELIESLGVGESAIVGHSMGSLIALEAAARHPARVRSLALIGTGLPMPVADALQNAADHDTPSAIDMLTLWGYSKTAQIGGNETPGIWMVTSTKRLFERAGEGVIGTDLRACNDYHHGLESAASVQCPTLLILGSRDVMTPPLRGREVAAAIAGSRAVVLDGAGHSLMSERPDVVLDALITIV